MNVNASFHWVPGLGVKKSIPAQIHSPYSSKFLRGFFGGLFDCGYLFRISSVNVSMMTSVSSRSSIVVLTASKVSRNFWISSRLRVQTWSASSYGSLGRGAADAAFESAGGPSSKDQ